MARIQHKFLPDEYLHEPKGATTAAAGTVYVADGDASGNFQLLPISSLDFTEPEVDNLTDSITGVTTTGTVDNIANGTSIEGTGLLSETDGTMEDLSYIESLPVAFVAGINKNLKELYVASAQSTTNNASIKKDIKELTTKLNAVISALKTIGLFNG